MKDDDRFPVRPIPPEDHPLVPWSVRQKLLKDKHKRWLEETYRETYREEKVSLARILIAFAALAALAYLLNHLKEIFS